jgi:CelD/BcsL family acetyltransferase involved in cellulose biosynthesis
MSPEKRIVGRPSSTRIGRKNGGRRPVASPMRKPELIDPFTDPAYEALVTSSPDAEIFHDRLWLELLRDEYGYEIGALAVRDGETLEAVIPFAEIKSRLTGNRLVALPFSDHCPPVLAGGDGLEALGLLGDGLAAHAHQRRYDLTVHAALPSVPAGHVAERFVTHRLALAGDADAAELATAKNFRQPARKARREGLVVERRSDVLGLEDFYRLHLETRRRLGVPTQPRSFILRFERLFAAGRGGVWVVRDGAEPIAAAIFLTHGRTVTYKYGASAASALRKRPNNLLLLEAIREHADRGFERFDFGRTDLDNEGLRKFKRSMGAEEIPLAYTYLNEPAPLGAPSLKERLMSKTIRRGPTVVGRLAGEVLYRHVG